MRVQNDDDLDQHAAAVAAPTLVRLTSSAPRLPEGVALGLAAEVRTVRGDGPAATGCVEFRVAGRLLGARPLDAEGRAALEGVRLAPGVHAITASYRGDLEHAAASSAPLPQAVIATGTTVVVLVAAPLAVPGGFQLEAEVVDPGSGRLAEDASGAVVFWAGDTSVASTELAAGHARVVVSQLPRGRLMAAFAGDVEHAAATGAWSEQAAGA